MSKIGIVVALVLLTAGALLPGDGVVASGSGNSITTPAGPGVYAPFPEVAVGPDLNPVIAYANYEPFPSSVRKLKVVRCGNLACSSGNTVGTPDAAMTDMGALLSVAVDANFRPVVAYHDTSVSSDLRVLHCDDMTCDGTNESITTPDSPGVDPQPSLQLDSTGRPIVAYRSNLGLKVMHCNDVDCAGNNESIVVVDSSLSTTRPSLQLDQYDSPVISYIDGGQLKLIRCLDPDCLYFDPPVNLDTVGTGDYQLSSSLALESMGLNDTPIIAYEAVGSSASDLDIRLLRCGNVICSSGNTVLTTVAGGHAYSPSLSLVGGVQPLIEFSHFASESGETINVLFCGNLLCSSGNTISEPLPASQYTSPGSAALSIGGHVVAYRDNNGDTLKVLYCALSCVDTKTPAGTNVQVSPHSGVTLTFDNVTTPGTTTVTSSRTNPTAPGFQTQFAPTRYDITTTATFTGEVKVCFDYDDTGIEPIEHLMTIVHNGVTIPLNDKSPNPNPDTVNDTVCAKVTSFSPFVLLIPGQDYDGDSCPNEDEAGLNQLQGGLRDSHNPHDYFNPSGDGKNRVDDILLIVNAYFDDDNDGNPGLPPYAPGYDPGKDRTFVGPLNWNLGPPNGQQRVDDILNSVKQYFHDCPTP